MASRRVELDMEHISAEIIDHRIDSQEVKTLLVDFGEGCRVLSTACGYKKLRYAANHYSPPDFWKHNLDFEAYLAKVHRSLGIDQRNTAMLVTAVNVDNLIYTRASHGDLTVGCLVTAGVKTNALRMGVDEAKTTGPGISYGPPGTINTILLTNANFTDGAMAMALINITEAKTGALQDLNVRSAYSPQNVATGTGTDGITVSSGTGPAIASTSGHLRIGELIGKTARDAVIRAIQKQRGRPDLDPDP